MNADERRQARARQDELVRRMAATDRAAGWLIVGTLLLSVGLLSWMVFRALA